MEHLEHASFVAEVLAPFFATREDPAVMHAAVARDERAYGTWLVLPIETYEHIFELASMAGAATGSPLGRDTHGGSSSPTVASSLVAQGCEKQAMVKVCASLQSPMSRA